VISAFGGMVSWEGDGAPFDETDQSITHQVSTVLHPLAERRIWGVDASTVVLFEVLFTACTFLISKNVHKFSELVLSSVFLLGTGLYQIGFMLGLIFIYVLKLFGYACL